MEEAWKLSLPPLQEEKLNKWKISDFPWTHQRIEDTGQTTTSRYGETGISRESQLRSTRSSQVETTGVINW